MGKSILAASLILAVMTLPVIITSKGILSSRAMAFHEARWNVGATKWQTIRRVVIPNSISGMLTGFILEYQCSRGDSSYYVHWCGFLQSR